MAGAVRVDFHCHSACSDGALPPEGVAHMLAGAGVRCAALTDHDTLEGGARFARALAHRGIQNIAGIELTAAHAAVELHLLGLGFRPDAFGVGRSGLPGLGRAIRSAWPVRGGMPASGPGGGQVAGLISRIHEAGGRVYLAHPLLSVPDPVALDHLLGELAISGLDGIEALYKPYSREVRTRLARLAGRHGLLVIAGSDFHGDGAHGASEPGCDFPWWHWQRFCQAHGLDEALGRGAASPDGGGEEACR